MRFWNIHKQLEKLKREVRCWIQTFVRRIKKTPHSTEKQKKYFSANLCERIKISEIKFRRDTKRKFDSKCVGLRAIESIFKSALKELIDSRRERHLGCRECLKAHRCSKYFEEKVPEDLLKSCYDTISHFYGFKYLERKIRLVRTKIL